MDRLHALRLFIAVVEHGSLSAAARTVEVSLATVSRSLARLERELGARLLTRTTRRLSLTPGGREYYERCKRVIEELAEADAALGREQREPAGRLTVSGPTAFGRVFLAPAVAAFLARHSKLVIELLLTDRYLDLVEEGVDVAVRTGRLKDSRLVARRVGSYWRVVCAAPSYLARAGEPKTLADLARHNCIVLSTQRSPSDWPFVAGRGITSVAVSGNWRTNSSDGHLAAALEGVGLALIPWWIVRDHVAAGRLRVVLREHETPEIPIQVVYPSARLLSTKVRAFVEFLRERWEAEEFAGAGTRRAARRR